MKEEKWYILRTQGQYEKKVAVYLNKLHIKHYLPLINKKRIWSDRIKFIDFPLFPGYIFIYFHWDSKYSQIIRHSGAVSFIQKENKPAYMSIKDLINLKLIVTEAKEIYSDPDKNFPIGQKVILHCGPLKGVEGTVVRIKNKDKIFVHLPLLNRKISAEIDISDLDRV